MMKLARVAFAVTLATIFSGSQLQSQTSASDTAAPVRRAPACPNASTDSVHTFYLRNVSQASDANEIYTAIRNLLPPDAKSFLVSSQNTIFVCGDTNVIALAQKLVSDLDHLKKNYRLTYTVTEMDAGRRIGTQHFAIILAAGQPTTLKQGSRVPVATGSYSPASPTNATQTQFTYLDVGMNITSTLSDLGGSVVLQTNVDQSSIAEEKSGVGEQDPVVRQTSLKGSSILTPGKAVMLGSVDISGSTRHLDLEVTMEPLP